MEGSGLSIKSPLCFRCRANVAHVSQSRPDSGPGFQVQFRCKDGGGLGPQGVKLHPKLCNPGPGCSV